MLFAHQKEKKESEKKNDRKKKKMMKKTISLTENPLSSIRPCPGQI